MTARIRAGLPHILSALLILAASVVAARPAAAAEETHSLGEEWEQALEPLLTMPVQDAGYKRSARTFCRYQLLELLEKAHWRGRSAMVTVFWVLADPQQAAEAPLLKVTHPKLAAILGGKRVSLLHYRDEKVEEKIRQALSADQNTLMRALNTLEHRAQRLEAIPYDLAILPRADGVWQSPADLLDPALDDDHAPDDDLDNGIAAAWHRLAETIRNDDAAAGRQAAEALARAVRRTAQERGVALPRLELDAFYQAHQPFAKSALLYLLATLGWLASLLWPKRRVFIVGGWVFLLVGLVEHAFGIGLRWVLAGRAPLANMYESFIFATAGLVLVALVMEAVQRLRLVGFGAALLGFILMVIAHKAPIFDSQIRPLVPALQSSWLTYHVVTIMLSYSAFALSFFVSMTYLAKDLLGGDASGIPLVRRLPSLKTLDVLNYKVLAVGFPLLTLGIVLGAVWADTAWGRPWGFDPKETWSAITWLVYAIYLHVRVFAGWKGRRAAIVALLGFACVLFTYLGVNYLLPSLHSYVN